jgi:hypothetical protein
VRLVSGGIEGVHEFAIPLHNELVLEITDQHADGRHYERRLVLERQ